MSNNMYNPNNPWTNTNGANPGAVNNFGTPMNQGGPGYTGFNNFQRPIMPATLPGRLVANADEITPQEVPMDGSVSLFPQNDYSCIYAKTWTKEGTIATVKFIPENPQNGQPQKSPLEMRLDRIDQQLETLNKRLNKPRNFQKRNNPHPKKEGNGNE